MRIGKTIIAGILFAAVLAGLIYEQRRIEAENARRAMSMRLVPLEMDEIASVSIRRSGVPLDFRKENDTWEMIRPVEALADQQAVADLLFFIDDQERTGGEKIESGELATFGLEHPAITVSVAGEGEENPTVVHVGNDSPAFGQVYARMDGANEWFTISADLRDYLRRPVYDYRDKSLLTMDATQATTLTLTSEGSSIEVMKREGGWEITRPVPMKADDARVEQILKEISTTKAADFIDTETLQLQNYGLEAPYIAAILYNPLAEENPRETLLIGRRLLGESPHYYSLRFGRDVVFTVPQSLVDALRPTVSDLRSKELFTLSAGDIQWFTLEFGGSLISLRKDSSGQWRFEDDSVTEVDQNAVNQRIDLLLKLRALEFFETPPLPEQTGLDDPIVRVVVSDAAGGQIEGLITGKLSPGGNRGFVYARRLNEDEVFAVPQGFPSRFFMKRDDFRDRTLFAFEPALVSRIDVAAGDKKVTFAHDGGVWVGSNEEGGNPYQVAPGAVQALILHLLSLRWEETLRPEVEQDMTLIKTMDLESPERMIAFYDSAGEPLARIGQGGASQTRVYIAKGEGEFFALDKIKYAEFIRKLEDLIPR